MKPLTDLTGRKFGRWLAIRPGKVVEYKNGPSSYYWVCRCDCGVEKEVVSKSLIKGTSRSCGCLALEIRRAAAIGNTRARSTEKGESGFRRVKATYRRHAEKRGLSFSLGDEIVLKLVTSNCSYCGAGPSNIAKSATRYLTNQGEEWSKFIYNGIDRVDSSKGYSEDNVVTCCKDCNRAKSDRTLLEFKIWVAKVYNTFYR